jgi:hypothetical protein
MALRTGCRRFPFRVEFCAEAALARSGLTPERVSIIRTALEHLEINAIRFKSPKLLGCAQRALLALRDAEPKGPGRPGSGKRHERHGLNWQDDYTVHKLALA